jgi:hypothetical protein
MVLPAGCGPRKVQNPNLDTVRKALEGREITVDDQAFTLSADNVSGLTILEAYDTGRDNVSGALVKFTCTAGENPVEVTCSLLYKISPGKATEVLSTEFAVTPPAPAK